MNILLFRQFFDEFTDFLQSFLYAFHGSGVRTADETFAAWTECRTGNHCHFLAHEKFFGKLHGTQSGGSDVREDIKSAIWFETVQTHGIETVDDHIAAVAVFSFVVDCRTFDFYTTSR